MTGNDSNDFLNRPIYALDFSVMLGDLLDLLEFSERNIEWLYGVEKQSIEREAAHGWGFSEEDKSLESDYTKHLLTNAVHRFTVSLPMRIRYAALVSFVTAVEWQAKHLQSWAASNVWGLLQEDKTISILRCLTKVSHGNEQNTLEDLEAIVFARYLVVHAAGLPRDYKHADVCKYVEKLRGFTIGRWHFLGETLRIERGALNPYIEDCMHFMPTLVEALDKKGLLD